MRLLKRVITPSIVGIFVCAVIFNILEGFCKIVLAGNTGSIVNAVVDQKTVGFTSLLVLGLIFSFLLMISIYIKEACFARALENTLARIRSGLFDLLINLDYSWMKQNNTNELVARISSDINSLTDALRPWIVMNLSQLVIRLISVIYLFTVNWFLTLIMLSVIPFLTWIQKRLIRPIKEYAKENQRIMGKLTATAGFAFQQREMIKAMALEDTILERFSKEQQLQYQFSWKERVVRALSQSLGMFTTLMTILTLFGVGAYLVIHKYMNYGELFAFYTLAYGVIHLPSGIAELISVGQKLLVCLDRMEEVYSLPIEEEWVIEDVAVIDDDAVIEDEAVIEDIEQVRQGDISEHTQYIAVCRQSETREKCLEFKGVSFTYEGKEELLRRASFVIMGGETVLLTGENGSGKSTIFNLITGFYETQSGNIFLSRSNIHSRTKKELRSHICYIPQEPLLFFGTIYDNVTCFNNNISKKTVTEILVKLRFETTLRRLPKGLESQVGEQGALLSGGERQRILIARSLIYPAELILLDEVAAGLEEDSEDKILSLLKQLPNHPAILYISHRDKVSREADRILRLREGRVNSTSLEEVHKEVRVFE
ncbi:MAG TPA: ABC transporter ATP-binding protein [Mobilitalea sp.]|nr:ABC transporter ATP-binding protein [Mobilitalea sp.]